MKALMGVGLALLLAACGGFSNSGGFDRQEDTIVGGASAIGLNDDVNLSFGTGTDYWLTYDATGTEFELWSTNCNGSGTDCAALTLNDGTDDFTFSGSVTTTLNLFTTGYISINAAQSLLFNGVLRINSPASGQLRFGTTNNASQVVLSVDTDNEMTLYGGDGAESADLIVTGTVKSEVVTGDAPAEPHACDAAHSGVIVTVDDTNNTAYDQPCVCLNLDGTGYDWRQLSDVTGSACVF